MPRISLNAIPITLREIEPDEVDIEEVNLVLPKQPKLLISLHYLDAFLDIVTLVLQDVADPGGHEVCVSDVQVVGLTCMEYALPK